MGKHCISTPPVLSCHVWKGEEGVSFLEKWKQKQDLNTCDKQMEAQRAAGAVTFHQCYFPQMYVSY